MFSKKVKNIENGNFWGESFAVDGGSRDSSLLAGGDTHNLSDRRGVYDSSI